MSKIIIVLGCYRSGTSLIAQLLHKSGVYMGDEAKKDFTAFYEDRDFIYLNKDIYKSCDNLWHSPNQDNLLISTLNFEDRIKELIDTRNSSHEVWGWKDPRQGLLIGGIYWKYLNKYKPYLIITSRNLLDCAISLKKFYTFKENHIEKATQLLMEYIRGMYKFLLTDGVKWPRYFISYEGMFKDDILYKGVCDFIGIKPVEGLYKSIIRRR